MDIQIRNTMLFGKPYRWVNRAGKATLVRLVLVQSPEGELMLVPRQKDLQAQLSELINKTCRFCGKGRVTDLRRRCDRCRKG